MSKIKRSKSEKKPIPKRGRPKSAKKEAPKPARKKTGKDKVMSKKKKTKTEVDPVFDVVDEETSEKKPEKKPEKEAPKPPEKLHKILAPLKNLQGSLQIRAETLFNYALRRTADPEVIVKDALALIKEAETMGLGPFKDIKKSLKG